MACNGRTRDGYTDQIHLFALRYKNKAYIQTVQVTYSFYKRSVASNKSHF